MKEIFKKEKWKYLFYTMYHPMDGFYWIRRKDRGSVIIALFLVFVFACTFSMNRLLAGFVVNDIDSRDVNSLYEVIAVILFYLLICVSNQSVTCLLNGEGRLKDILITLGYSTLPITISLIIATALSRFISLEESAFYYIIIAVGIAYGVILMFIGIMQIHNYTLTKALITMLLTFVAMLIIVFLILLLFNLCGMVVNFIKSVYTEIVYR